MFAIDNLSKFIKFLFILIFLIHNDSISLLLNNDIKFKNINKLKNILNNILRKYNTRFNNNINFNNKSDNYKLFYYAIKNNNFKLVKLLLDSNAVDINKIDDNGNTPLHLAIISRNFNIFKLLLSQSEIDIYKTNQDGYTPLFLAILNKDKAIVKLLLKKDLIDINKSYYLEKYLGLFFDNNYNKNVVQLLLYKKNLEFLFFNLIYNNCIELVKLFLDHKIIDIKEIDIYGYTPLTCAICNDNINMLRLLLSQDGLNINQSYGYYEYTALIYAISIRNLEAIKLMLKKDDIDVNQASTDGFTPLIYAVNMKNILIVKLLLNNSNIDVNKIDIYGSNALSYAIYILKKDIQNNYILDIFNMLLLFCLTNVNINISLQEDNQVVDLLNQNNIHIILESYNLIMNILKSIIDTKNIFIYKKLNQLNKDELKIFIMILSFKKFFDLIIDHSNYYFVKNFINSVKINGHIENNYKIYLDDIDLHLDYFYNRIFQKQIFQNNLINNNIFKDIDIFFS